MNQHPPSNVAAVGVGALAGAGSLLTQWEPILASASYIAAIIVAIVTLYFKFRDRRK